MEEKKVITIMDIRLLKHLFLFRRRTICNIPIDQITDVKGTEDKISKFLDGENKGKIITYHNPIIISFGVLQHLRPDFYIVPSDNTGEDNNKTASSS